MKNLNISRAPVLKLPRTPDGEISTRVFLLLLNPDRVIAVATKKGRNLRLTGYATIRHDIQVC